MDKRAGSSRTITAGQGRRGREGAGGNEVSD